MKNIYLNIFIICLLVFLAASCGNTKYDAEVENLASIFASGYGSGFGGIGLTPEGKADWRDLAEDIFMIKEKFLDETEFETTTESEQSKKEWFKHLKNELIICKNGGMNKYLVAGRRFLEQFRKHYDIEMDQRKWDDHDWDGNPNWNDPDAWEYWEENK